MAKFLNTSGAYAAIEDIISKASNKVVLISPYLQIPETLLKRLKYIDGKGIKIIVVCRKDNLKADVRSDLKQLKSLELRFDEHLHAKCFYNEESMVITSLNLYEYSQQHNREMGILLSLKDDHDVFNEARNEAEFIVSEAEKDRPIRSILSKAVKEVKSRVDAAIKDEVRKPKGKSYSYKPRTKQKGYCIGCGKDMTPYNKDYPICHDCWKAGVRRGRLCYECGKEWQTTQKKSLCDTCYSKSMR